MPKDSLFARQTFGRRSWRAAKIIIIGELATMAFFAAMPESFSNWNKNFYRNAATHWKNAFTMPPKFDNDPVMVNFIQHPLAGAIYYNGIRSQEASPIHSFFHLQNLHFSNISLNPLLKGQVSGILLSLQLQAP